MKIENEKQVCELLSKHASIVRLQREVKKLMENINDYDYSFSAESVVGTDYSFDLSKTISRDCLIILYNFYQEELTNIELELLKL